MSNIKVKEIIFVVKESDEGGYEAEALGHRIYTEADEINLLKKNIKEAVECHFEKDELPKTILLHYVKEEILSL